MNQVDGGTEGDQKLSHRFPFRLGRPWIRQADQFPERFTAADETKQNRGDGLVIRVVVVPAFAPPHCPADSSGILTDAIQFSG